MVTLYHIQFAIQYLGSTRGVEKGLPTGIQLQTESDGNVHGQTEGMSELRLTDWILDFTDRSNHFIKNYSK